MRAEDLDEDSLRKVGAELRFDGLQVIAQKIREARALVGPIVHLRRSLVQQILLELWCPRQLLKCERTMLIERQQVGRIRATKPALDGKARLCDRATRGEDLLQEVDLSLSFR